MRPALGGCRRIPRALPPPGRRRNPHSRHLPRELEPVASAPAAGAQHDRRSGDHREYA
ncbi:MAG: hypothetical protein MZW92_68250 [Comamonadaceae bacterium]|nr:hypothetical protein [Comamonadaceae bacterium]